MIDKLGLCPNCQVSWDAGDTLENINKLDIFANSPYAQKLAVAGFYGWKENSKTNLSKVIVWEINGRTLYQCPKLECGHVFDKDTGEQWRSLNEVRNGADSMGAKLFINVDAIPKNPIPTGVGVMEQLNQAPLIVGTAGELNIEGLEKTFTHPIIEGQPTVDECPFEESKPNLIEKIATVKKEYDETVRKIDTLIEKEKSKNEEVKPATVKRNPLDHFFNHIKK